MRRFVVVAAAAVLADQTLVFRSTVLIPHFDLRFRQVQMSRQFFAFLADDVVILLEGVLELQQLRGRERRSITFRLAERVE